MAVFEAGTADFEFETPSGIAVPRRGHAGGYPALLVLVSVASDTVAFDVSTEADAGTHAIAHGEIRKPGMDEQLIAEGAVVEA